MPDTIGTAYIQIKPTTEGIQSELNKEMASAGESGGKSFGSSFSKILGTSGAVIGGIATAIGGMSTALVNATSNVAEYGDNIDKMSQKMGISAEAYQEWEAVMQHSGTSMETLKASMKTMANAALSGNEAFQKLGISEKEVANMSQEDLFSTVISQLQNMEEGTERTYLAGQLLGRGATELGALLNTSAEDTQAMKDRVHELGGVLSDDAVKSAAAFQDQLQDMQTSLQGIGNNLISEFLPGITEVMGGLTDIFQGGFFDQLKGKGEISKGIDNILTGITEKLPDVMKIGTTIILAIADSIVQNLPSIISTGMDVIINLADGMIEMLPTLIESLATIVQTILTKLTELAPTLIPKVVEAVIMVVNTLIDNLPLLLEGVLELIKGVADGIITALPILIEALPEIILGIIEFILESIPQVIQAAIDITMALVGAFPEILAKIVEALPEIIVGIITALMENLPLIVQAGIDLFISLIDAMPKIITEIVKAVPKIIKGIVDGFKKAWPQIKESGKQLLTKIMEGLTTIGSKISTAVNKIWTALKNKFAELATKAVTWGKDLLDSFINGIKSKISSLTEAVKGVADTVKDFLGFSEPEEGPLSNFHTFAPDMIDLFTKGIYEGIGEVDKAMQTMGGEIAAEMQMTTQLAKTDISTKPNNNELGILELLSEYLPYLAQQKDVNVSLEGNANGLFNLVKKANNEYKKQTGISAFV